jgi:isopenicillin N synthase-like dioxygenase
MFTVQSYHDALARVAHDFVRLLEAAFAIPAGTFDSLFRSGGAFLPPQHRIKLLKYAPQPDGAGAAQGVGPHADTSGWLTFLLQAGGPAGLDVLAPDGRTWLPAPPAPGTLVVNFGKAMEAATGGAVRATVHRVRAPAPGGGARYSVPFFMGLPAEAGVRDVWERMPAAVRDMRGARAVDGRWECFGDGMLAKWLGSHRDVGMRWYGAEVVERYAG